MEPYNNWEEGTISSTSNRIPLPHEEFDQYFNGYNEVDSLFNETLTGLQDLDVPSGFVNQDMKQTDLQQRRGHQAKHSRKVSGTAIFGFTDHGRELSISGLTSDLYKSVKPSVDLGKSISPGQLFTSSQNQLDQVALPSSSIDFSFPDDIQKPLHFAEEEEYEYQQEKPEKEQKGEDYIVTNKNPKSYKFPPSPDLSPNKESHENSSNKQIRSVNNYSVKYLQHLNKFNSADQKPREQAYIDDIRPLLERAREEDPFSQDPELFENIPAQQLSTPFNNSVYKYVPIPVQNPGNQPTIQSERRTDMNDYQLNIKNNLNAFLPPPSPPTLSNGSPEWNSSPEPQSPSPSRVVLSSYQTNQRFSSPIHAQVRNERNNFYTPQFFSDDNGNIIQSNMLNENPFESSPGYQQPLNSSPTKYYSSPLKNATNADITEDANETITQLTPLKNQAPITPHKNKVTLEWSPIISPESKSSKDLKKSLQESSLKRSVKKTSLLPPGELDQYWQGPDESKNFTCTYKNCGKKFTRRYNVRSHIQTHLSDRPFACSYCAKKFVRQHDLNRHVKGHLEARYCKCSCGKEFSRVDALKKHKARNICAGGSASNENHCITKPHRKNKQDILDNFTSDRLVDEINSNLPVRENFISGS